MQKIGLSISSAVFFFIQTKCESM